MILCGVADYVNRLYFLSDGGKNGLLIGGGQADDSFPGNQYPYFSVK